MEQAEWDPDVDGQSFTLRNPGMDISSSTPGPCSQEAASSSSGLRPIEPSSGMGGNRVDSMVVPGGRVELSMQWAIRFYPEDHSDDCWVSTSGQGSNIYIWGNPSIRISKTRKLK